MAPLGYFVCLFAIAGFLYFIHLANAQDDKFDEENKKMPAINQTILQKLNCDSDMVYSFTDQQCNAVCASIGNYLSRHGVCVNALAFKTEEVENVCDPKRGVLAYLTGNSQFGSVKLRCLTIDDGIQPSDLSQPNIFCQGGGSIDINYLTSYPQLPDCKCPSDKVLALVANTNAVRSRGVCVDKKFEQFYKLNNLLYV